MQPDATDLTLQQRQAIELFARGQAVRCIATTLGVSRETLWRWRQLVPFAAALQQARAEQYDQLREQAQELMRLAMVSVARELKQAENPKLYNPLETAFKVLEFITSNGLGSEMAPASYHHANAAIGAVDVTPPATPLS